MSGLLPQPDVTLAAFSLQSQLLTLCFMVPLSFGFATATRVGKHSNANAIELARAPPNPPPPVSTGMHC